MESFPIVGLVKGLQTNVKPAMLPDQAWAILENSYTFRERELKREGRQFLGRLRRIFTNLAEGTTPGSGTSISLFPLSVITMGAEPQAEIEAGSLAITVGAPDTASFTDRGDGTFTVTGAGVAAGSHVNYITGQVVLNFTSLTGGATITTNVNYFPTLPAMGIYQRDIASVNMQQTIWFDEIYAYAWNGTGFQELTTPGTTWAGTDSDFFWAYNYRGTNPQDRLFFVTNFVDNASNPMRYFDGSAWNLFQPILTATIIQNQLIGTVTNPWTTFSGSLSTPIIEGSVSIQVGGVSFTDVNEDGTLTGTPSTNTGTINYTTGAITLSFSPALGVDTKVLATYSTNGTTFLFSARILIAYYGRLLALNTWEGASYGSSVNIFNRCRFSEVASPIDDQAWRSDIFGRGGFLDAPVNEEITGATFVRNTLIVDFQFSTWQLRYVGEYGLPFIWERVSADFGSESTFSGVLFDNHRLAVGDKAITAATGTYVDRIDLDIPDQIFNFKNANNGVERVFGIRDFKREIVFWNYADAQTQAAPGTDITFPNKVLLYNYRNKSWAVFRDSITCFGTFQSTTNIKWDSQEVFWDSETATWADADTQSLFPLIVCGDQQGFISCYGYDSPSQISTVAANDQETLTIQGIAVVSGIVVITSVNHNLIDGEIIYITGMKFLNSSTFATVSTSLNNTIYKVQVLTPNTFSLLLWNFSTQIYANDFTYTPNLSTSIYVGGGRITLFPRLNMLTKDINVYQGKSLQTKLSRLDFLFEPVSEGAVAINLWLNASTSGSTPGVVQGNLLVGNKQMSLTLDRPFYTPGSDYAWFRFYATLAAQYFSINITYDDNLMNTFATHSQPCTLYAINAWCRAGGKNVF